MFLYPLRTQSLPKPEDCRTMLRIFLASSGCYWFELYALDPVRLHTYNASGNPECTHSCPIKSSEENSSGLCRRPDQLIQLLKKESQIFNDDRCLLIGAGPRWCAFLSRSSRLRLKIDGLCKCRWPLKRLSDNDVLLWWTWATSSLFISAPLQTDTDHNSGEYKFRVFIFWRGGAEMTNDNPRIHGKVSIVSNPTHFFFFHFGVHLHFCHPYASLQFFIFIWSKHNLEKSPLKKSDHGSCHWLPHEKRVHVHVSLVQSTLLNHIF